MRRQFYFTIDQYRELIKTNQTDKSEQLIALYTSDPDKQHGYIQSAEKRSYDVLVFNNIIDSHFIQLLEHKNEKFALKRVDSDVIEKLIDKDQKMESVLSEEQQTKVKEVFEKAISNANMKLSLESLPIDELPVSITFPEFMRRMKDMSAAGGSGMSFMGKMPEVTNVVVNTNHKIIQKVVQTDNEEEKVKVAKQAYDLALL
ncbi:MAG: molecular chaperone HtpG, partial [Flavobacterium sp.]